MTAHRAGATPVRVHVIEPAARVARDDLVAIEEPLEIRVAAAGGGEARTVALTMRTPGADFELAAGFLHTEGVVADRAAVRRIDYCSDAGDQRYNVVTVRLASPDLPELASLDRYGTVSSACGVCGKTSLDALELRASSLPSGHPRIDPDVLHSLPAALRQAQRTFSATGGLHAAGVFTATGDTMAVREDVGRHNAVDKVVGWALLKGVPVGEAVLVVSGRAGFEIVQKAVAARIPVVCAVSAPSSLAVDVATRFDVTLVGFLRDRRANVYAGADRIG